MKNANNMTKQEARVDALLHNAPPKPGNAFEWAVWSLMFLCGNARHDDKSYAPLAQVWQLDTDERIPRGFIALETHAGFRTVLFFVEVKTAKVYVTENGSFEGATLLV